MKTIQITNRRLDTSALVNMATDYEVEHWQFVLPTAYDGVTLPLTGWGVGYQRADSQGDIDERVTVAVVEDNLTVEYAPKDGIVAKAGPLTIWLQCVDADGHSVYQTLPAVITVARKPVPTNIPNDQDFLDRAVAAALEAGEARDESEAARDGIFENAGFQAVAGALVPIGTVADAVGSVQTVAEHVGAVGAVAGAVEEVGTVAGAVAKVSTVADSIIKVGTVADSIVKVGAVADGMAHVTAVEAKLTEVAKVAAIDGDVAKVALIDGDVSKVAALEQSVPVVAGVADELEQLAPVVSQIEQLALIKDQIVSLEAAKAQVVAVEANLTEIQGVYAKLAAIEGVYGKSTEIDALYAQLDTIAAKANQADLDAVEDRLDTLEGTGAGSVAKAIDDGIAEVTDQAVKTASTPTFVGIKFPATQVPSADPNTLDDYEEGTWTPTITLGGGSVPAYSHRVGKYTKVGNTVHCFVTITCNGVSTPSGAVTLSGLPFSNSSSLTVPATVFPFVLSAMDGSVVGQLSASGNTLNLRRFYKGMANNDLGGYFDTYTGFHIEITYTI